MNPTETARLVRLVAAACPAQKFEDGTPLVWLKILVDLRLEDCQLAVVELGKRLNFISPADIRGEVRRIRNERLREQPLEPDVDGTDPRRYLEAVREHRRAIGDGKVIEPTPIDAKRRADVLEFVAKTADALPQIPAGPSYEPNRLPIKRDTSMARAVGRWTPTGPDGYRAVTLPDAPLRATRAEAEADELAYREFRQSRGGVGVGTTQTEKSQQGAVS